MQTSFHPVSHHDISFQQVSILDIKRNVQDIKAKNLAHRQELQKYFMTRSHVQTYTFSDFPSLAKANTPKDANLPQSVKRGNYYSLKKRARTEEESNKNGKTQTLMYERKDRQRKKYTLDTETQTYQENPERRAESFHSDEKYQTHKRVSPIPDRHTQLYSSHLSSLQSHYQTLNNIMLSLRKKPRILLSHLQSYLESAPPTTSFLDEFILQCDPKYHKALRTARFLEMISILYVGVELALNTLSDNYSNLGNFVGYSASSLVLLAKLYIITEGSLKGSRFQRAIVRFERITYLESLRDPDDIVLRIQHNNEIGVKIQGLLAKQHVKLQARLRQFTRQYHQQNIPSSLAFIFLFEYLSYYLHANNLTGIIPCFDTAPLPYLPPPPTPKPTIIIQPLRVLFSLKHNKLYVRPHTSQFLQYLTLHADVVFWTHVMPNQIEGLLDRVDKEKRIEYRLFRYHCLREKGGLVKDVGRLGREKENVLWVDESLRNWVGGQGNGVEMYWEGDRGDQNLIGLCEILAELFGRRWTVTQFCRNMQDKLMEVTTVRMKRILPIRKNLEYRMLKF